MTEGAPDTQTVKRFKIRIALTFVVGAFWLGFSPFSAEFETFDAFLLQTSLNIGFWVTFFLLQTYFLLKILPKTKPEIRKLQNGLFALGVFLTLVAACECFFYFLSPNQTASVFGDYKEKGIERDSLLGYKPKPNACFRSGKCRAEKDTVYNVEYCFDNNGLRKTYKTVTDTAKNFLACFGCSMTFGEGCGQRENMPYFLDSLLPNYSVYNFGFHGYGAQHALAWLGKLKRSPTTPRPLALYFLSSLHVPRIQPNLITIQWLWNSPYFDPNQDFEYLGSYIKNFPVRTFLLGFLGKSYTIKRLFPLKIQAPTESAVQAAVLCLAECKKRFQQNNPNGKFAVVLYPKAFAQTLGYPYDHSAFFRKALAKQSIEFLDLSELYSTNEQNPNFVGRYAIIDDGHPNAAAHGEIAQKVARWLTAQHFR